MTNLINKLVPGCLVTLDYDDELLKQHSILIQDGDITEDTVWTFDGAYADNRIVLEHEGTKIVIDAGYVKTFDSSIKVSFVLTKSGADMVGHGEGMHLVPAIKFIGHALSGRRESPFFIAAEMNAQGDSFNDQCVSNVVFLNESQFTLKFD